MTRNSASLYLPILLFLCLTYVYVPESIDDAYITLRYSRNLMTGYGPVFNPGEHVEGYSNFIWMVLLALVGKLGFSMPAAMKLGGIASAIVTIAVAGRAAREWFHSEVAATGVRILLAVSSFFALWAADGLETSFYTMLITLLLYESASSESSVWIIGMLAGIAALTRPEGVMFGVIAVAFIAITRSIRHAVKSAAPFFAMTIGYEAFRWFYFAEWVSNTALAKVHSSLDSVTAGLRYFWSFNEKSGYLIVPAAAIGAIGNVRRSGVFLAIAFVGAQLVFLAVSGGDFMFGYRFVVPIIPCLLLLAIGAAMRIQPRSMLAAVVLIVLLAVTSGYAQFASLPPKHIATDNLWYREAPHFEIARFIDRMTTPSDTVLLSEAGIIPFGIRARVDDYLGLTSAFWYVHKRDRTTDVDHLLANKPKVVVLSFYTDAAGTAIPRLPEDYYIFESPEFQSFYTPAKRFDFMPSKSFLNNIYYFYTSSASTIYFEVFVRREPA